MSFLPALELTFPGPPQARPTVGEDAQLPPLTELGLGTFEAHMEAESTPITMPGLPPTTPPSLLSAAPPEKGEATDTSEAAEGLCAPTLASPQAELAPAMEGWATAGAAEVSTAVLSELPAASPPAAPAGSGAAAAQESLSAPPPQAAAPPDAPGPSSAAGAREASLPPAAEHPRGPSPQADPRPMAATPSAPRPSVLAPPTAAAPPASRAAPLAEAPAAAGEIGPSASSGSEPAAPTPSDPTARTADTETLRFHQLHQRPAAATLARPSMANTPEAMLFTFEYDAGHASPAQHGGPIIAPSLTSQLAQASQASQTELPIGPAAMPEELSLLIRDPDGDIRLFVGREDRDVAVKVEVPTGLMSAVQEAEAPIRAGLAEEGFELDGYEVQEREDGVGRQAEREREGRQARRRGGRSSVQPEVEAAEQPPRPGLHLLNRRA